MAVVVVVRLPIAPRLGGSIGLPAVLRDLLLADELLGHDAKRWRQGPDEIDEVALVDETLRLPVEARPGVHEVLDVAEADELVAVGRLEVVNEHR